ncbi:MAG: type IV pilin N-terminal domain-containing protein [Methanomicrobiales archaeon]|nr:type IV pilin N-terminal domain-containing protein [Methanomicrobiales archaeon]
MKFFKDEEAVSPVIGVILMVAITVILAAVIAAFVFGMTGNVATTKSVGVTATQSTASNGTVIITITYQGGPDAGQVAWVNWSVALGDESGTTASDTIGNVSASPATPLQVGSYAQTKGSTSRDHVVATAHFLDGGEQVVLDTYV